MVTRYWSYATVTPSRKAVPYEPGKTIFREQERDVDPVTTTYIP